MKKIITIGLCLFICVCVNHVFGQDIISTNGGFEIAGGGAGAAEAAGWSGTPDSALSRTDAAANPLAESFGILNVDAGGVRDQWICLTNIIPVMPSGQQGFSCELIGRMSSGTVYFDDLEVIVIPEPVFIGAFMGLAFFFRKINIEE